jgi:cytidylate kinase
MQREIINNAARGIVVEGRDIGTTVWPDAELKIFLTADLTARAERRNAELARALSHNDVEKSLAARDVIDSTRASSPLRQTDDQVVIDATHLSIDEVVSEITKLVAQLKIAKAVENDE